MKAPSNAAALRVHAPAALRAHALAMLDGGGAHARARDVLRGFPRRHADLRLPGFAHSAWELLEHLRIAQRDLLHFGLDPDFRSPKWPRGFWPSTPAPASASAWQASARAFLADLKACQRLARDRHVDLLAPLAHSPDTTWFFQLMLVADHNAYHLGQLMQLRRALESGAR
ncbi:MAG: DinB family protein [Planctomycetes bacterium]|nr:DinB family protein [Planctomycetota bacterium]